MKKYHKSFSLLSLGICRLIAVAGLTAIAGVSTASDNRNFGIQLATSPAGTPLAQELQAKPAVIEFKHWLVFVTSLVDITRSPHNIFTKTLINSAGICDLLKIKNSRSSRLDT